MTAGADAERALARAYRFLGRRERTRDEMHRHLQGHGFEAGVIERTVTTLADQGYLDDERFARLFVEDKRTLEGWGRGRIARTLLERGLDRDLVNDALCEPEDEHERALALLRRRYPGFGEDPREHERALGFLLRKGYESELALEVLRTHRETVRRAAMR